jgi:hypothetical protein
LPSHPGILWRQESISPCGDTHWSAHPCGDNHWSSRISPPAHSGCWLVRWLRQGRSLVHPPQPSGFSLTTGSRSYCWPWLKSCPTCQGLGQEPAWMPFLPWKENRQPCHRPWLSLRCDPWGRTRCIQMTGVFIKNALCRL